MALAQHFLNHRLVAVHALHLVVGAVVVRQFQPGHAVENRLDCFRGRAGDVGVLDAQHEGAAVATGVGPGKQRGAGAANVQVTGGAGGESGADRLHEMHRQEGKVSILADCV